MEDINKMGHEKIYFGREGLLLTNRHIIYRGKEWKATEVKNISERVCSNFTAKRILFFFLSVILLPELVLFFLDEGWKPNIFSIGVERAEKYTLVMMMFVYMCVVSLFWKHVMNGLRGLLIEFKDGSKYTIPTLLASMRDVESCWKKAVKEGLLVL